MSAASIPRPRIGSQAQTCTLNGAIVEYDKDALLLVGLLPYQNHDNLDSLRKQHRQTHFFRRERENIASVALSGDIPVIGQKTENRRAGTEASLVASLALDALMRYFHQRGRPIWGYKPLRMISGNPSDQLLRLSLPSDLQVLAGIEQRVSYTFDTRSVYPEEGEASVLLV